MLKPSLSELMSKIEDRYLLVNLAAEVARDLAQEAEDEGRPLPDKAVKLALQEIADGEIIYSPGHRGERTNTALTAAFEAAYATSSALSVDLPDEAISDEALFEEDEES